MRKEEIVKRLLDLEIEVKRLNCEHRNFIYKSYIASQNEIVYIKHCGICGERYALSKEEYYEQRLLQKKKEFEDLKEEARKECE